MEPQLLPTQPQLVAPDTFLVPTLAADPAGGFIGVHTLLIRGAQPVIVDTGCSLVREHWLSSVFSVVDPQEVRWVYLSHDDHDHIGNIDPVLEMCPNATLIVNFSMVGRLAGDVPLPLDRMRWLDAGESLDIGDRVITAVRPPVYDSPSTRGLYDSRSKVLWAVDAFAAHVPDEMYDACDVPAEVYDASFVTGNGWNTPWLSMVDPTRFAEHVHQTSSLDIDVIASSHGPLLRGDRIADGFRRLLALAGQPVPPMPGQELLDVVRELLTVGV